MAAALLLEPASAMPVAPQIRGEARNHNNVADARFDPQIATGAHVRLAGLIRLYRMHGTIVDRHPKNPHATNASVATVNTTTRTMSAADRF